MHSRLTKSFSILPYQACKLVLVLHDRNNSRTLWKVQMLLLCLYWSSSQHQCFLVAWQEQKSAKWSTALILSLPLRKSNINGSTPKTGQFWVAQSLSNCGITLASHLSFSCVYQWSELAAVLEELRKREKEMGIEPDWNVDALMKAETLEAMRTSITTEFVIRMLGLGICSDTLVSTQEQGILSKKLSYMRKEFPHGNNTYLHMRP